MSPSHVLKASWKIFPKSVKGLGELPPGNVSRFAALANDVLHFIQRAAFDDVDGVLICGR